MSRTTEVRERERVRAKQISRSQRGNFVCRECGVDGRSKAALYNIELYATTMQVCFDTLDFRLLYTITSLQKRWLIGVHHCDCHSSSEPSHPLRR